MKIVIFGLGSIGKRHARILLKRADVKLYAFRSEKNQKPNTLGLEEVYTWDEVESITPDAAIIANPTFLHVETAVQCAMRGMHLFIEKPLSMNSDEIDSLEALCEKKNLTCYVAYCLRFHPVIKKLKELFSGKSVYHARVVCSSYLPDWRKDQDHRKNYSAFKDKGGGVILDLSHEFDYIQHLFGPFQAVKVNYGKASDLTVDSEDFADVLIVHNNSVNVNVHLNFLSRMTERNIKVDFEGGYLIGDLSNNQIIYSFEGKQKTFKFDATIDDLLTAQMEYFLDNLNNQNLMNNLGEAKALLQGILSVKDGRFAGSAL